MTLPAAAVLVEPFDLYLRRRAVGSRMLSPGEAVTAAVALLRGCRRATRDFVAARWWLRADGCPIAVEEAAGADPVAATADALTRAADAAGDPATRDILIRARESVLTRPPREWDALERRLLSHAAPAPLVLGPLSPLGAERVDIADDRRDGASSPLLALVDADLADGVRAAVRDVIERWRSSRALRLGAVIVGVVATVLIGAALLPAADEPTGPASTATAPSAEATPDLGTVIPETRAPAPADARVPLSDDVVAAARALFVEISACGDDSTCVDAHMERSSFPREPIRARPGDADVALLDDFGGVAVVRLQGDEATQYVTLIRQKDRWLVRAVRTVADQPS
ncbi:hypothetical protein ACIPVB_12470 [Microbacterium sp. NPDC090007]|uniref:hypothetical protein n=1 Tax=Microbacterium sp. NPDC090007 TaxID=3364204 RepID=UPI003801EEB0